MSIESEILRIITAKGDIGTAIAAKGVTVPASTKLDGMDELIAQISGGGGSGIELPPGWTYDYGTITLAADQTAAVQINLTKGYKQAGSVNQNNCIALLFSPEVMLSDFNSKVGCFRWHRNNIADQFNMDMYRDAYINGSGSFAATNNGDIRYYNNIPSAVSRISMTYISTRKLKAGRKYYGLVFGEALT